MFVVGDFVTPLKKRRLARESLSIDDSIQGVAEDDENSMTFVHPATLRSAVTPPDDASSSLNDVIRPSIDEVGSDLSIDAHDEIWSRVSVNFLWLAKQ